jgi:hypothetical protein
MAAPIAGRKGRIYIDVSTNGAGNAVPIANLSSWSLNRSTDKIDTTTFGSESKTYVVSLPDAALDFSGFWDTDGDQYKIAAAIDGGRKTYLYVTTDTTTKYWFGKFHFDVSVSETVSGAVEVSGSAGAATSLQSQGI